MQYGQNISIPYSQPQADNNNMFNIDHKNNLIKTKMERDRDDGKVLIEFKLKLPITKCVSLCLITVINQQILQNVNQSWQTLANPANSVDYSSHILSATLPISIQHFLKYSETIKKEQVGQPLNSGNILGGIQADHSSGFNIKSDMMGGLKNGITSHGMNGMIHTGMNNHGHGLDSANMVETTTANPTTTTKSGKKKKVKPPKVKTVRLLHNSSGTE